MKSPLRTSIVFILVLNAVLGIGWWYVYRQSSAAAAAAADLAKTVSIAEAKQNNIRELAVLLQDIEADEKRIAGAFIGAESFVPFIEEIERIAATAGVTLVIESVSLPQGAGDAPSFRIRASGAFGAVYRWLGLLETMRYLIAVDSIQSASRGDVGGWSASVQIRLLSFNP